ncbi:2,3-diaminopropionate biosynthesis protein SbnA [Pseudonocardia alni]|uniref:N-(2-amino-2-carboxyethyl)-L-glutamate synthase n=1 Tax=Pseudonocardia alni TaxID=33907 RepID=A0A852W9W9_PSEA5|nr:2,3-diaminopropionate biosynthesis protein SbnA [Pseudonocardia antarctica]NYG05410.1 cysteine synthase A [Pseudonocardia antarctica]
MIEDSVIDCIGGTPTIRLGRLFAEEGVEVIAKLEALNPGGSIKDRPARYVIDHGLRTGAIRPDSLVVESTSGNLGVGLATVCKIRGLRFRAVVDPNITRANLTILEVLGAEIDMVTEPLAGGGMLAARIARVRELIREDPSVFWVNQYANTLNAAAHRDTTAEEIVMDVGGTIDVAVIAVSSGGTVMGVARRLRALNPDVIVIGADVVGSVLFGGPPADRRLPGIGSSRIPELLRWEEIDRSVHVTEAESIEGCRMLAQREAILAGASSGSVIAAIRKVLPLLPRPVRIVTILPDRGERYLNEIFNSAPDARLAE